MIKVWHAKQPTFGLTEQKFPEGYELVAYVHTDKVDRAFEQTNHIDCEWWDNDGVKCVKKSRSTSVGDVLEMDGKLYRCEMSGWKEIPIVPS